MKEQFKNILVKLLWKQVARLRKKHNPTVVAVAGSIGKTGTKTAIAQVLSRGLRVQWQSGNYNDIVSVPLIFFGQDMPALLNPLGWLRVFLVSERQIRTNYPYDVVVVEVGSDYAGNLELFTPYLQADYGVLTGVSPEHMENFTDLDAVAKEELTISQMSNVLLVNTDAVDKKYLKEIPDAFTYGEGPDDCRISAKPLSENFKRPVSFAVKKGESYKLETSVLGKQNLPALAAAILLATQLKLKNEQIMIGLESIKPVPGRMQLLKGEKGSLIIDDSYNASPDAVIAALDTLYEATAKQKIAILGQMNELGDFSEQHHKEVGAHCDPKQLTLVVTVGEHANTYLAEAAEKRGCKVMRCPSPYHAADVVRPFVAQGTLILGKGSQNRVFVEEALKHLLANPEDARKLVRQSASWMKIKQSQFKA